MKFKKYLKETDKTWRNQEEPDANVNHALLGLLDEAGELASAFKKEVGYGKELDLINVKEEIGDGIFFLTRVVKEVSMPEHLDKMLSHLDEIAAVDIPEEKLEIMKTYNYSDLAFNLNKPIGLIYEGLATKDDKMIGQAMSDTMSAYANLAAIFGFTAKECMTSNIAKLKKRFPDKYSKEKALKRDLDAERKTLEE